MDTKCNRHRDDVSSIDSPPYSRLFIVCDKKLTEDQFKEAFEKFGNILDVRIPHDHDTGEARGIAYIKFSKTSEAAKALEEMNHKSIAGSSRPLKVMVATNRSEIQSDDKSDEKYRRLFITVPKIKTENSIEKEFSAFGHIESVTIQRDRETGDSKGFAYVKFLKFSEAARAFEEIDKSYRAIFAIPKGSVKRQETASESNFTNLAVKFAPQKSLMNLMNQRDGGFTEIQFMCCPHLTHQHVEKIFDIVPGMVNCQYFIDLMRNFGKGIVTYSNSLSASYAVEKINELEYPPGMKIFVKPYKSKFDAHEEKFSKIETAMGNLKSAMALTSNSSMPDLAQLAEAISEASKLIKTATAGVSDRSIQDSDENTYCSVPLPPRKPLVDINMNVKKRCFLVCKPQPPPLQVLKDVFCRFGDLINVYTLANKTIGYALYASVEAANAAIETLHGADICGIRMKVLEAEEKQDSYGPDSKRQRYY